MILLIQLAQVSTCVNIYLVSQIPGNSDGSVPFLVWSIFRWTIRNQSLLWYLWHYPGWFSWFYWFDTLQRIQTYHRVKLTDHFWFVLILVLCSSWKYKILVALAYLSFALLHGELKWKSLCWPLYPGHSANMLIYSPLPNSFLKPRGTELLSVLDHRTSYWSTAQYCLITFRRKVFDHGFRGNLLKLWPPSLADIGPKPLWAVAIFCGQYLMISVHGASIYST